MKNNLILLFVVVGFLGLTGLVFADQIILPNPLGVNSFAQLFTNILDFISTVAGSLAVLVFVVAGIFFVISAGDPGKVGQAKKTALYAVIGLAIALAARGLILVIKQVIGA